MNSFFLPSKRNKFVSSDKLRPKSADTREESFSSRSPTWSLYQATPARLCTPLRPFEAPCSCPEHPVRWRIQRTAKSKKKKKQFSHINNIFFLRDILLELIWRAATLFQFPCCLFEPWVLCFRHKRTRFSPT